MEDLLGHDTHKLCMIQIHIEEPGRKGFVQTKEELSTNRIYEDLSTAVSK